MRRSLDPSRRRFLRGIGATLTLPWMESLVPRAGAFTPPRLTKPPVRLACLFMPNGVVPEHWTPAGDGSDYGMTPMLQPLADVKSEFLLLENLWNKKTDGRNGHWPKVPAWLSGGYVERGAGGDIDTGGTSIDQLLGQMIGHRTAIPTLELGVDETISGIDTVGGGFPRMLGSHIAWRDPHTPVPKEIIPQLAFDRLFRNTSRFPVISGLNPNSPAVRQSLQRDDASVLDLVRDDAKSLQRELGAGDQHKLEEYLDSVRDVERRIENTMKPQKRWINEGRFDLPRPGPGIPESHEEHVRLMLDLMLLAFWTDSTRICTFMFGNAQTGRSFDFIEGVRKRGYHGLSHHRNKAEEKAEYEKIGTWHVGQFAHLLRRMRDLDEGGSSLLDNSMLLFGSSIKDGNTHDARNLPLVLAGKGGGSLKPGRRVRAPKDTPMCNLHLSLLHRMGVEQEQFGDSSGTLDDLV